MDQKGLVFIGIDIVADALDVAETRRWTRTRAPAGLWRRLGAGTGIVLRHADAPVHVAIAPADASLCGIAESRSGGMRVVHDPDLFEELVEDCPVVDELVRALLATSAHVSAA